MKNYLHALKEILHDTGPGSSESCQIAIPEGLEVQASYLTTIIAEEGPHHQKE